MTIIVGMLVGQKERQEKYKRIISQILLRDLNQTRFLAFSTMQDLYNEMILNHRRADILILQATENNIRFARLLRETDTRCLIIYPAKNMNCVLQAIGSMPIAYVPAEGGDGTTLTDAIAAASRYLKKINSEVSFETKSSVLTYSLAEIDYFESCYRIVDIVKRDGSKDSVACKLDEVEARKFPYFTRCHQSYLINMGNIKVIDKSNRVIYFYSGQSVTSSKNLFSAFLEEYRKYLGERANNEDTV